LRAPKASTTLALIYLISLGNNFLLHKLFNHNKKMVIYLVNFKAIYNFKKSSDEFLMIKNALSMKSYK